MQDIQSFIKEKVLNNSNADIASEGLHAYASMSDSEDVQELISSLREEGNNIQVDNNLIMNILTETALSTAEAQADMLPDMLNDIENNPKLGTKEKETFNQIIIESLNAGVLTEESQKELAVYMQNNEPKLQASSDGSGADILKYYRWAEAGSKINNNDMSLENIALESDNPLKVSSILLYGDAKTIQNIKQSTNIEHVYSKLESALDGAIGQGDGTIIRDAMATLKEDIEHSNK